MSPNLICQQNLIVTRTEMCLKLKCDFKTDSWLDSSLNSWVEQRCLAVFFYTFLLTPWHLCSISAPLLIQLPGWYIQENILLLPIKWCNTLLFPHLEWYNRFIFPHQKWWNRLLFPDMDLWQASGADKSLKSLLRINKYDYIRVKSWIPPWFDDVEPFP